MSTDGGRGAGCITLIGFLLVAAALMYVFATIKLNLK